MALTIIQIDRAALKIALRSALETELTTKSGFILDDAQYAEIEEALTSAAIASLRTTFSTVQE